MEDFNEYWILPDNVFEIPREIELAQQGGETDAIEYDNTDTEIQEVWGPGTIADNSTEMLNLQQIPSQLTGFLVPGSLERPITDDPCGTAVGKSPSLRPSSRRAITAQDAQGNGIRNPKFKRRLFKPILQGNNRWGRVGRLSCEKCRKRKIKCKYDVDDPQRCEYCTMSGNISCIKLRGPKQQARIDLISRPIAEYDPPVDSESRPILDFIHSHQSPRFPQMLYFLKFIQVLAQKFGRSFQHSRSLRHAIFAFTDSGIFFTNGCPQLRNQRKVKNYDRAIKALRQRLEKPDSINEGDLFASTFLALADYYDYPKNQEERMRPFLANLGGFLAIANYLCDSRKMKWSELSMYWHSVRENFQSWSDHCWPFCIQDSLERYTEFMQVFGLPICRTFLPCLCTLGMSLSSTGRLLLQEKLQFLSHFSSVRGLFRRNCETCTDDAETLKSTLGDDQGLISENTGRKLDEFKRIVADLQTFPNRDGDIEVMWIKAWTIGQDLILPAITRFMAFLLQTKAKPFVEAFSLQKGIELGTYVASRILYVGRLLSLCSRECKHESYGTVSEHNRQSSFTIAGRYYLENSIWYIYSLGLDGKAIADIFQSLWDSGVLKSFSNFGFDYPVNIPLRRHCGVSYVIDVQNKRGMWAWAVSAILEGRPLPLNLIDTPRCNFMAYLSEYSLYPRLQPPFPILDATQFQWHGCAP